MSNKVQGLIWDIEFPNSFAKIIALKLADNANDEGGDIYPATTTVARRAGCSRSAVCKWQFAMEHCRMLLVVERSLGGSRSDTTERAFNMALLRRLAREDKDTPPELMLVEEAIERQAVDKKGNAKFNDDGSPKMVKLTVLVTKPYEEPVHEVDGLPVHETDGSGSDPSTPRTPAVHEVDTSRPRGGHEPFKVTLSEPFDSPPTPQGVGEGLKFDWVEELRAEGCAPVVLDHLLVPLLSAGLKPWKDTDPKGPGRQLAQDHKRRSAEVLAAAADRLLSAHKYRLPPVATCREAVEHEGKIAAAKFFQDRQSEPQPEVARFEVGTPEYEAELARWERDDPDIAAMVRKNGFVKIKTRKEAA